MIEMITQSIMKRSKFGPSPIYSRCTLGDLRRTKGNLGISRKLVKEREGRNLFVVAERGIEGYSVFCWLYGYLGPGSSLPWLGARLLSFFLSSVFPSKII